MTIVVKEGWNVKKRNKYFEKEKDKGLIYELLLCLGCIKVRKSE